MQQQPQKVKKLTALDMYPIQPLTEKQKEAYKAFNEYDVISLLGSAGTGKSFLACHMALKAIVSESHKKLLIVRTAVPTREVGHLPGALDEKKQVYERPYISIFDQLIKYKSNNYINMKGIGIVDFESTSFMRGETFDDTIVVFDEVQNASFQELDTVMTRCGENTKMIFVGDGKQADLRRNGLEDFMNIVRTMPCHGEVEFGIEDVVRSGIVKEYLIAKEEILYPSV